MNIFAVVVTYNGSKWIEKCFTSLINSAVPLQIIAIDNASTDDTVALIKDRFPIVNVIENNSNLGFGQANNLGLKIALKENADYVFLLNQDAWIEKNTIEELIKVAYDNPGFGILSPFHLDTSGEKLERTFQEFLPPNFTGSLVSDLYFNRVEPVYETKYIHAAAWFMSRDCITTVGGFDPIYFHYGEDDDYLMRTTYFKFKIGLVPSSLITHDCVCKSWQEREWDVNRNMVIELQHLKKMSPHFRTNLMTYFKSRADELTTLLLYRKFKKFKFRFFIVTKIGMQLTKIKRSFTSSFLKGAFLNE